MEVAVVGEVTAAVKVVAVAVAVVVVVQVSRHQLT